MSESDRLKNLIRISDIELDADEISPLGLAYIGDAIFEILVRMHSLSLGNAPVAKLHKMSRAFVNAKAQSDLYFRLADVLTEKEQAVFKRGRNAKSNTIPKNAEILDYKHATGIEAVFGYLYIKGEIDRIVWLFNEGTKEN
ncbi:MAG: ribonuclease III domain-containing protein [Lachnospiraceae bacterium]|nr:ribonuclease III domain-containing protein [Lachnospiraceae bacterium]